MRPAAPYVIFAIFLALIGAVTDARSGKIPNWLTLPPLFAAPLVHGAVTYYAHQRFGAAFLEFGLSIAGAVVCAAIPLFLFVKRAIGGGDLKLFAALGAVCLPVAGFELQLHTFAVAAIYAPAQLFVQRKLGKTLKQSGQVAAALVRKAGQAVPEESMTWFRLGPSIFLGAVIATARAWW